MGCRGRARARGIIRDRGAQGARAPVALRGLRHNGGSPLSRSATAATSGHVLSHAIRVVAPASPAESALVSNILRPAWGGTTRAGQLSYVRIRVCRDRLEDWQCSIGVNDRDLATMAAMLAAGGRNPVWG